MTKQRIIPADAGSTKQYPKVVTEKGDHPRGCGEHNFIQSLALVLIGSSPRMRGALHQRHEAPQARRIIPADAGSTLVQAVGGWQTADHPRGCGEHLLVSGPSGCPWGSSPRMRGAPLVGQHGHVLVRIIPADAGSTPSKRRSAASAPDHPRGCGEHRSCLIFPFM